MQDTSINAFLASVERFGECDAVVTEDGARLSYRQLDAQRRCAARGLYALGVRRGDRVAIWAQNRPEWIVAGLAIHSLGAAIVPANTRMKGEEVAWLLERSGARVLFCTAPFLGRDYIADIRAQAPAGLESVVVLGAGEGGAALSWVAFMSGAEAVSETTLDNCQQALRGTDCMDILFTSGTTGRPKGVVTTHEQNLRAIRAWSRAVELVPQDRYLIVNPFFHSFGYKVGWLVGLMVGLAVLPHAVFDAHAVLQRIERDRVTVLPGPPTLLISLLNDPDRSGVDLSSLRATITGAATIAPSLIERTRVELGFETVLTGYGLTESCGIVSLCDKHDDVATVALTSGKAVEGIELRCVDADNQPVAAGQSGEIVVRGYNVMQAYLDDPAATRNTIDAQGWLHTGDVGELDARGYLKITDRLKDMYICGGFNCYPAEIERAIAAHPAVAQVAVIGVPDARMGEVGRACIIRRPGRALTEAELIAFCRDHIANYKVPRQVVFCDTFPTNAAGKVLKFALRESAVGSAG